MTSVSSVVEYSSSTLSCELETTITSEGGTVCSNGMSGNAVTGGGGGGNRGGGGSERLFGGSGGDDTEMSRTE